MTIVAIVLLVAAGGAFLVRVIVGPSLADRVVALDGLIAVLVAGVVVQSIRADTTRYLDAALVAGFIGFVGTVAAARFVERGGR